MRLSPSDGRGCCLQLLFLLARARNSFHLTCERARRFHLVQTDNSACLCLLPRSSRGGAALGIPSTAGRRDADLGPRRCLEQVGLWDDPVQA